MQCFDAVVVGGGAAGLFCAGRAGQRGLKVLLIDHSAQVAEKIRISGGGRCNFTNRDAGAANYLSANPHFCRSALSRYTPSDFIALLEKHGIRYHEKHKGQLFCDGSANDIIAMLLRECDAGAVTRWSACHIDSVVFSGSSASTDCVSSYRINSNQGPVSSRALVVASGGLSIPATGASDFGYRIASQFGLRLVAPRPGLVPLTFDGTAWAPYANLAGLALPVHIATGSGKQRAGYHEDLLFTHRGLSGPAILQISNHWQTGTALCIDLLPGLDLGAHLLAQKGRSRKRIATELAALLPERLALAWVQQDAAWQRPLHEASDKALLALGRHLNRWQITPSGTEGYKKAEVTLGGVDTRELSSQTLESRQPGLYFIGEVVDVTGWLGGYNFQWAWASAAACAQALPPPA